MKRPQWWLQLQARSAALRERYAALQPREQQILLVGAIVVALALAYLAIWEPAATARQQTVQALADARDTAVRIERLQAISGSPAHKTSLAGANQSLLATVDQASKASRIGTPPSRLQPDGDTRVRVWFENVSFDSVVGWLNTLQTAYGIRVENAEFTHKDKPGLVDVRLSLVSGS